MLNQEHIIVVIMFFVSNGFWDTTRSFLCVILVGQLIAENPNRGMVGGLYPPSAFFSFGQVALNTARDFALLGPVRVLLQKLY
ncbi:MAG: hypothetical protein IIA14_06480 [SAR324 cluster bacterium]|nr:hypothetical protein [SAR324 cluster bacterium]